MRIKLPQSMKAKIRNERNKVFEEMREEGISQEDWEKLDKRRRVYSEMLKPTWRVSPDVTFSILGQVVISLLVLYYETDKFGMFRSKVFSFIKMGIGRG